MNKKTTINKQTYNMLPLDLKMVINAYGFKNSNYKVNNKDLKNKWYLIIEYLGISFKIPFKALFHTNSKIKGIKGLDFSNATYCISYLKGYCKIPNKKYCYAYVFELQYLRSITSKKGFLTFNAYYKGFLLLRSFKVIYSNKKVYNAFIDYIGLNIKVLRFNVNSDFNGLKDLNLLLDIAKKYPKIVIYGYTARNDLMTDFNDYKPLKNITFNGSNCILDNQYKATFELIEYFKALNKCIGSCNDCKKCFKLNNAIITTLFHNSNSDSILNTISNRNFIITLFKAFNIELSHNDLTTLKGLFSSLNKHLKAKYSLDLKTNGIKGLKDLMDALYKFDKKLYCNMSLYDLNDLKGIKA